MVTVSWDVTLCSSKVLEEPAPAKTLVPIQQAHSHISEDCNLEVSNIP